MTEDDIRHIIRAVLEEERASAEETFSKAVQKALPAALATIGIIGVNDSERRELQADFSHLRRWRKSVEQAQGMTLRAIIVVIVSGLAGAVWLGFKTLVWRQP
jgi:hypothetical protein